MRNIGWVGASAALGGDSQDRSHTAGGARGAFANLLFLFVFVTDLFVCLFTFSFVCLLLCLIVDADIWFWRLIAQSWQCLKGFEFRLTLFILKKTHLALYMQKLLMMTRMLMRMMMNCMIMCLQRICGHHPGHCPRQCWACVFTLW